VRAPSAATQVPVSCVEQGPLGLPLWATVRIVAGVLALRAACDQDRFGLGSSTVDGRPSFGPGRRLDGGRSQARPVGSRMTAASTAAVMFHS
jgi:hypothetical protein